MSLCTEAGYRTVKVLNGIQGHNQNSTTIRKSLTNYETTETKRAKQNSPEHLKNNNNVILC